MRMHAKLLLVCTTLCALTQAGAADVSIPHSSVKVRRSVEPVDLRCGPQLFIDEYLIAESANLKRAIHPPAPGFEASQPLKSDSLAEPVQWSEPLSKISSKSFRLEFIMRKAALFGFSFKGA